MLGNVVPGGYLAPIGSLVRFEVLGSVLLLAALWILGRTWFDRAGTDALPVPALLIAFGLAFDAFIVVGRTGTGPAEAVDANRYLLANLIVLTGIVVYVVARLPYPRDLRRGSRGTAAWRSRSTVGRRPPASRDPGGCGNQVRPGRGPWRVRHRIPDGLGGG